MKEKIKISFNFLIQKKFLKKFSSQKEFKVFFIFNILASVSHSFAWSMEKPYMTENIGIP